MSTNKERRIIHAVILGAALVTTKPLMQIEWDKNHPLKPIEGYTSQQLTQLQQDYIFGSGYIKIPPNLEARHTEIEQPRELAGTKIFTDVDSLAALKTASPMVRCTIDYEAGGGGNGYAPYDPNIIGKEGYLGIGQLDRDGKLPEFYKFGYQDWRNPHEVVAYMNSAFNLGQEYHWGPVSRGLC